MLHLKYYDVGYVAVEGVSVRKSVFLEFILLLPKVEDKILDNLLSWNIYYTCTCTLSESEPLVTDQILPYS